MADKDAGERTVTKKDRDTAVKRELLRTTSRFTFTAGMKKAVRSPRPKRAS